MLLHASDSSDYIIFITDYFSDRKLICYDVSREHFFDFYEYPDLRFIDPLYSSSSSGDSLYIFDGEHQSFAMLSISIDFNDAFHHPKVSNIRKTTRQTAKLRNLVKTGKHSLCIYLPDPWNEFHIIGGAENCRHLRWDMQQKQFVNVAKTEYITKTKGGGGGGGIIGSNLFFFKKVQSICVDNSRCNQYIIVSI